MRPFEAKRWRISAVMICGALTVGAAGWTASGQTTGPRDLASPIPMPLEEFGVPFEARWQAESDIEPAPLPPPQAPRAQTDAHAGVTIAHLEQLALRHNPTLGQASRRIEALCGTHLQVGIKPNPSIGYIGEEIGDGGRAGQQGIQFQQTIITGGKLALNRAVVSYEIAQAQQEFEMQRRRVLNDVRIAAYHALAAQQTVTLAEQLLALGEAGVKAAEGLFQAKEVSRADVLQARIEANSARLTLETSSNNARAAWRRLAMVVGVPDLQQVRIQNTLPGEPLSLTWDGALTDLMAASPELGRAYAGVERARRHLARQCAGQIPDVTLGGGIRHNFESETTVATASLSVPLQIFNRNQGNILRAQAELAEAHREVERVELSLQDRLAVVFREYENARQRASRYRNDILPDAKASLDLVQQGYEGGEFGYLQLLTAQRTYFETNVAYIQALAQLWTSTAEIDGLLLRGGLARPGG